MHPFTAGYADRASVDGCFADRRSVAWDLAAAAYRKRLAEVDPTFDAESIENLFTQTKPGNRPLLVSLKEEGMNAA